MKENHLTEIHFITTCLLHILARKEGGLRKQFTSFKKIFFNKNTTAKKMLILHIVSPPHPQTHSPAKYYLLLFRTLTRKIPLLTLPPLFPWPVGPGGSPRKAGVPLQVFDMCPSGTSFHLTPQQLVECLQLSLRRS